MHGDGGAFSKQDYLFVLSWNSIVASNVGGRGFGKRFLYSIVRTYEMTPATLPMLFTVFAWSCNALLTGITPEEDWNQIPLGRGEFIAERWRASMVHLRGAGDVTQLRYPSLIGRLVHACAGNV